MKTTRDMILEVLTNIPMSANYLRGKLTGKYYGKETFSQDRVRSSLKRLVKAGKVIENKGVFPSYRLADRQDKSVPAPAVPVTKPKRQHVILVLDNSGSMSGVSHKALEVFQGQLRSIKENAAKFGIETLCSIYTFGAKITPFVIGKQIDLVQFNNYYPNEGETRLLDGIGTAINGHKNISDSAYDDAFLLVAITDGQENASYNFNKSTLNLLINEVQLTDKWTVSVLVPPNHKSQFCRNFNIPEGNVKEWEQSTLGLEKVAIASNSAFNAYYASRSVGQTRSKNFFVVDASNITSKDLNKLNDVSGRTKSWTVEKETDIKAFAEEKLGWYTPGTIYYQLTKSEEIQSYKQLLVQEKFKRPIYAGNEARRLLGIPENDNCKVKPGNLGNYDVFVQSTSNNRKLVRGTKLINFAG